MPEKTAVRALKCRLESSNRKNEKLRSAVDEYQDMARYAATMLPSIPEQGWSPNNNTIYQLVTGEFEDRTVKAAVAREAGQEVASSFKSWRSNGKLGDRPVFGNGDYLVLSNQDYEVTANDGGFGLKAGFIPYEPEWWHLHVGDYQREYIERALDEDDGASFGSLRLRHNDGDPLAEMTVTWDVEVPAVEDVSAYVGVDLGENVLYSAAVRDAESGDVLDVHVERGREFRHHRERLTRRRDELQRKGDLKGVKLTRNERERYTDHVTHRVARELVDLAVDHYPAAIRLEDLSGYRESAADPIHDWPYAAIREKVLYKAASAGVPVEEVDPAGTSVTCRKCGHRDADQRLGHEFECIECGYEVHADVNAAMNVAGV